MKYLIILSALFLAACNGTKDIEEFDKRVEYCKQHGATYKTVTNSLKEVFVYCLKDGREFNSKIFENKD
jgi:hypothetical protein